MTVDEYVEAKVAPEFRDVVAELRWLLREHAPQAEELISYGQPMYKIDKPIAWITASKSGITLGFREGRSFDDKYGLLKSASRHAMNVHMKSTRDVNPTALANYIRQAVAIDTR